MNTEEKLHLITRNLDEIITTEDVKSYLDKGLKLKHYIGFEISGKIHLGNGLMSLYKIKDLIEAGVETTIFLADWHAWINDKLGGNREIIRGIGMQYFMEGFKASMKCVGGNPDDLNFLSGSDLIESNKLYWETVIDVSKNTTLSRMKRSTDIAGRQSGEDIDFAKLIYPAMQVADIFAQQTTIAHAGMDQRKAHVIARDVATSMNTQPLLDNDGNKIKPIALHHHLLLGLGKPAMWPIPEDADMRSVWTDFKMSKSKPNTAIFITDTPEEISAKIKDAFCPEGEIKFNPILDWAKHLLFVRKDFVLNVERPEKFGGNVSYENYESLEKDFLDKNLHPLDLKTSVAKELSNVLEPARKHFESGEPKRLKEEMEKIIITR